MTKKLLLLLAVAVLLSFSLAKSQETGTIRGRVSSHDGKPLANVKIECYLDYQRVAVVSSDSQGKFVARGLIPGKYLVHASLEGYELWKGDNLHGKTGRTAILNISLKPGILVPETVVEPEIVEL